MIQDDDGEVQGYITCDVPSNGSVENCTCSSANSTAEGESGARRLQAGEESDNRSVTTRRYVEIQMGPWEDGDDDAREVPPNEEEAANDGDVKEDLAPSDAERALNGYDDA